MSVQKYSVAGDVEGKTGEDKAKSETSCLSTCVKIAIFALFTLVLIVIIIVLAIMVTSSKKKYTEREEWYMAQIDPKKEVNISNICLTRTCIESASRVNQYLDVDISPCDNFYQYACGGWEKDNYIPYYAAYGWSVVEDMSYESLQFFRDELEKPIDSSSFPPDVTARKLYATCMDTLTLESTGLSEARKLIDSMGGLSFNVSDPYPEFDLTQRLIDLSELHVYPLFKTGVAFHHYKSNLFLLDISPVAAPLLFSKQDGITPYTLFADEFLKPWNDLYAEDESPPAKDVFMETYAIMGELKEALDLDLVKTFSPNWNDTVLTIDELQTSCPQINWTRVIQAAMGERPLPQQISVPNEAYFIVLKIILDTWNPRALDNFLKFSIVTENLAYFPYKYRRVQDNLLNKIVFSKPTWNPPPRWMFCVEQMKVQMPLAIGRWYIKDYVESEDAVVSDVDTMIENIRSMYIDVMEDTDLLDRKTREFAIQKIKAMDKQVAFSPHYRNKTIITELYNTTVANESSSFFMNVIDSIRAGPYKHLGVVGQLSDEDWGNIWLDNAYVTNGFYSSSLNRFTILAGILQGAFYELKNPKFLNYGSMGFTIGHEFTHGFDDTGRHYGLDGLVRDWWTSKSEQNYMEAKQCYSAQYSKLEVKAYRSNATFPTNGNSTLDENIADNGAEYVVFQAYEKWVEEHGEEKLLPTPYLDTWQKQYYVAQAQGWCAKYSADGLTVMLDTFSHSQKEARVNGMYQNSVRFADIFQCPAGSFMNPVDKCTLW